MAVGYNTFMLRQCATPFVWLVATAAAIGLLACPGEDAGAKRGDPCSLLRSQTCGEHDECAGQGWCETAKLLVDADETGDRCQKALADPTSFPVCAQGLSVLVSCDELTNLVCGSAQDGGSERPCNGEPACANALLLAAIPDGGSVDAAALEARCKAAQYETLLYPPCQS